MSNGIEQMGTAGAAPRKRVAVYCRVSTESEFQLESLENQMKGFQTRLDEHEDWDLANLYVDEGLSGTSMKHRVQFNQMIEDCSTGMIDYIITKSVSRFARNTVDTLQTVRKLKKLGIFVYFEKEGIDTADSTSEMILTVMASFAQEESRSISENVKWGIRKRFEAGHEVKVSLYGFYHTEDEMYLIQEDEAVIVREVYTRYAHGEMPQSILNDMIARGVKPPAGDCWKRLQLDRMLKNEKYVGDSILQKTYIEDHIDHKQVRNSGETIPIHHLKDVHEAIVERHLYDQVQEITAMRKVSNGNSTYPYGTLLRCPHCGKPLAHGSLNTFFYKGAKIQNGGWGCYGDGGCGHYLLVQNLLDEAVIAAYEEKYGEKKEQVDYYWLDDTISDIQLGEKDVTIQWRDGDKSMVEMDISEERYFPTRYSDFYNDYLERVRKGETKNKYKHLMGLDMEKTGKTRVIRRTAVGE